MANTRRYAHFIAAMEQRTLLGAAQMVNISQPALSKSIQALEDEYGVKLFDRHPRGLNPTVYGYALDHHARRILLDIQQSKTDLKAVASGAAGRVRVGVGQMLEEYVEQALVELEKTYPSIDNTVITDYAEGLRLALLENRVDIVLGMVNRLVDDEDFETTIVATDPIRGLCHKNHDFAWQEVSLDELIGKEWIVPEHGEVARSALEAFFLVQNQPPPRFKVVTNIPTLVGRYVRDYPLLSLSPMGSFAAYEEYDLAWFKIRDFEFYRQIGIVQRANVAANPLTMAFKEILGNCLGERFGNSGDPRQARTLS